MQSQDAHVFHFNCANAVRMLKKIKGRERMQALSNIRSVKLVIFKLLNKFHKN